MITDHIYIVPIYDMQVGDSGFDEKLFLGYRDWILSKPNVFTYLGGDNLNCQVKGNKASEIWDEAFMPAKARKKLVELLKPLADDGRILGAIDGNHEYRVWVNTGESPTVSVLEKIGVPAEWYDPDELIIRIAFKPTKDRENIVFNIYAVHGWGGARKSGGHVNKIEELQLVVNNADVYTVGHEHSLTYTRGDVAYIPTSLLAPHPQLQRSVFVGCGTFCRLTKFQKRIQRRIPNIGAPRIRLGTKQRHGHRIEKDIHVSY